MVRDSGCRCSAVTRLDVLDEVRGDRDDGIKRNGVAFYGEDRGGREDEGGDEAVACQG